MTILIADDEERDRNWLKDLLVKNFAEEGPIHEACDGQSAVDMALKLKPKLVCLDIKMPHLSGIKAAEQILAGIPKTGVIILSNFSDEVYVRQLWKVVPGDSVFGYVLKSASNEQVVEAVRAILSGDCWIHPGISRVIQRTQNRATSLTPAEFEALICIALGLTDSSIARHLYLTEKAVQSRLKSLYSKMSVPGRGERQDIDYNQRCRAVYLAYKRGLINQSELDEEEQRILDSKAGGEK